MTQPGHQTAPTHFVDAAGVRFAYRRFGTSGGVPLVLNMHFTGTMDHWDPLVTDGLAATREVIPFEQRGHFQHERGGAGLGRRSGGQRGGVHRGAGLAKVDVLGFSLGGLVAQALTVAERGLVRRLVSGRSTNIPRCSSLT